MKYESTVGLMGCSVITLAPSAPIFITRLR